MLALWQPFGVACRMEGITYSIHAQHAMAGGAMDARKFFKKAKPTGNEKKDELERMQFKTKIKIMDLLCQREDLLQPTLSWIEEKIMGVQSCKKKMVGPSSEPKWPSTYIYMERIPKYWRGEMLLSFLSRHGLTSRHLTALDAAFPNGINQIFDFLLAVHPKTKIPRAALDKKIMQGALVDRMQKLGRAHAAWLNLLTNNLADPPELHWDKAGVYQFEKAVGQGGGFILKHVNGDQVLG